MTHRVHTVPTPCRDLADIPETRDQTRDLRPDPRPNLKPDLKPESVTFRKSRKVVPSGKVAGAYEGVEASAYCLTPEPSKRLGGRAAA